LAPGICLCCPYLCEHVDGLPGCHVLLASNSTCDYYSSGSQGDATLLVGLHKGALCNSPMPCMQGRCLRIDSLQGTHKEPTFGFGRYFPLFRFPPPPLPPPSALRLLSVMMMLNDLRFRAQGSNFVSQQEETRVKEGGMPRALSWRQLAQHSRLSIPSSSVLDGTPPQPLVFYQNPMLRAAAGLINRSRLPQALPARGRRGERANDCPFSTYIEIIFHLWTHANGGASTWAYLQAQLRRPL
jgi:hypothetical protein